MVDIDKWATTECIKVVFKQFIKLTHIIKLVVEPHLLLSELKEQKLAKFEAEKLRSIQE